MKKIITLILIICLSGLVAGSSKYVYYQDKPNLIYDTATKLLWIRCNLDSTGNVPEGDCLNAPGYPVLMTWSLAKDACAKLVYEGRSDWRLPSIKELVSILYLKHQRQEPDSGMQLMLNLDFFPNNHSGEANNDPIMNNWSSTELYTDWASLVLFDWGAVQAQLKSTGRAVRCVAGPVSN